MDFESQVMFFPDVLEEFYIFAVIMDPVQTLCFSACLEKNLSVRLKIKINGKDRMISKL